MKHISTQLKTAALLLPVLLVAACSSKKALVKVDETVKLAYLKEPDAQHSEAFSKNLGATLNKNRKKSDQEPGMMSDYAVSLVKLDRRAEANSWFNKEMEAFPGSRPYILKLKSVLLPEYVNDNTIREFGNADGEEGGGEQPKQLSPAKRKAAEERAKNVIQEPKGAQEIEAEVPAETEKATDEPEAPAEATDEAPAPATETQESEPQASENEPQTQPTE